MREGIPICTQGRSVGSACYLLCSGRGARAGVRAEPSRQPSNVPVWLHCASLFSFSATPDRSETLFPCRREGEEGGEEEKGGVRLFVLLHSTTCKCSNCILMLNSAEASRDHSDEAVQGGSLSFTVRFILHTQMGKARQVAWVCVCALHGDRHQMLAGQLSVLFCNLDECTAMPQGDSWRASSRLVTDNNRRVCAVAEILITGARKVLELFCSVTTHKTIRRKCTHTKSNRTTNDQF